MLIEISFITGKPATLAMLALGGAAMLAHRGRRVNRGKVEAREGKDGIDRIV